MEKEKKLNVIKAFEKILTFPNAEEFWGHYSRLTGSENPLSLLKHSPIEQMVDEATGYQNEVMQKAFEFFLEYVWFPLCDNKQ
jgi:hypothetical protein